MKVAYITMQFPVPSETFASSDVKVLKEYGVEIEVFSMRPSHKQFENLISQRGHDKSRIFHLSLANFLLGTWSMLISPRKVVYILRKIITHCGRRPKHIFKSVVLLPSSFYICKKIKRSNPDMVHLFWGHYPAICAILLKKYNGALPVSIFLGAHDLEEGYGLSSPALKTSDLIFTHSKANVDRLLRLGGDFNKIQVVYRGTIIQNLRNSIQKKVNSIDIPIMTAARLIKEKGVEEVLMLVYRLRDEGFNATLTVAGDGPEKSNLEIAAHKFGISNYVVFTGHIDQSSLFEYMESATFFVLMSSYYGERLPNVIKEAMLRGTIPITTPTIGIDELIENGEDGWVVNNIEQAFSKIKLTVEDLSKYLDMSSQAKLKIVNNFDSVKNMGKYKSLWENLI